MAMRQLSIPNRPVAWPSFICSLSLLAAVSISTSPLPAQAVPSSRVEFSDQVSVEWVSVSAVVESNRRSLPPLEPGLFRIFVDGREVEIEEFEPSGEIVHLLYLQDVSGSMDLRRRLEVSKAAYSQMVRKLQPRDELSLGTFAAPRVELQHDFTSDTSKLAGLEDTWRGYGETALIDTAASIPQLTRSKFGRVTALIATDGVDTASELPVEQVRTLLSSSGIPVYVFGLEGDNRNQPPTPGSKKQRAMNSFATEAELRGLRELARASGGRYVNLTGTSVELAVSRVLRDIRNRVFLGFPTESHSVRKMHTLEVRFIKRSGVVHHRTHYFGYEPKSFSKTERSARQ